jgi:hypothetical protein
MNDERTLSGTLEVKYKGYAEFRKEAQLHCLVVADSEGALRARLNG